MLHGFYHLLGVYRLRVENINVVCFSSVCLFPARTKENKNKVNIGALSYKSVQGQHSIHYLPLRILVHV